MSTVGNKTVTISYAGVTATYEITVEEFIQFSDETIIFKNEGYSNQQNVENFAAENFTIKFEKYGNNTSKYYDDKTSLRVYAKTKVIFESKQAFRKIEIVFGVDDGNNIITTNTGEYENGVWIGDAKEVIFDVGLNESGEAKGNRRFYSIFVSFSLESSTPVLDSISLSGTCKTNYYTN